jgi:hypothetical protein
MFNTEGDGEEAMHRGINYDTGFLSGGISTHEPFDSETVRREMLVIRNDLHCTAVRITGGDAHRLELAAKHAADAGLEVWFCPFTNGLTEETLLDVLAECADRAERIRRQGAEVVLLTGSEVSLFTVGFIPGDTLEARLALLSDPLRLRPIIADVRVRLNAFLRRAVETIRSRFSGPVSYASLPLERVDWGPFDIMSTDAAYRSAATKGRFSELVRAFVAEGRAQNKPVAVTEFGCMTFRGAADSAADIHAMVEWEAGRPVRPKDGYVRDEAEQAADLLDILHIYETEGIDATFVYTFARWDLPHRSNPRDDLDVVSCGVVKVLGDAERSTEARHPRYSSMGWEPKAAFYALADSFSR